MKSWSSGRSVQAAHAIVIAAALVLAGCAIIGPSMQDEQAMQSLGAALSKLSSAVDVTVAYEDLPDNIGERELLLRATQHDPALLRRFDGYGVRVLRQGDYVVLLVCTDDRRRALLEDATCTGRLDRHAWREADAACAFSLLDKETCNQ